MAASISSELVTQVGISVSVDDLLSALTKSWSLETSTRWIAENPARGQCSVTALVVQDFLGGTIIKTMMEEGPHFYNHLAGSRLDLTVSQFASPPLYQDLPSTREEAFLDCSLKQYAALRNAIDKFLI